MHGGACKANQSSDKQYADPLSRDGSIGDLFRHYGETYIKTYKPDLHKIKFIRAVRLCKTPALGGHRYLCKKCGHEIFVYHSCGHSQCPLCQSIKRAQWQDQLGSKLLSVPYTHTIFTIPHQLNRIAKQHPVLIYNLLMRSAWKTIRKLCADPRHVGALPGMISVLHTFGSDMKFHLHVHSLITFGGVKDGQWIWPKRKKKVAPYRQICSTFKEVFLKGLDHIFPKLHIDSQEYQTLRAEIASRRWNVRSSYPTLQTGLIENYLARYINRVAISKNRLKYLEKEKQIQIVYNDYRGQQKNEPAPKAIKNLSPMVAIHQILQHLLPPYFQKSRYYGLHAAKTFKKIQATIPTLLRKNGHTIRTVFQILNDLLGLSPLTCEKCHQPSLITLPIAADPTYIPRMILSAKRRAPPSITQQISARL